MEIEFYGPIQERPIEISETYLESVIRLALKEDLGEAGDVTTTAVLPEKVKVRGYLLCKAEGVLAGIKIAEKVFKTVDGNLIFRAMVDDGARINPGQKLALIEGLAQSVLAAERTALNFLQHLSGIATLTAGFVEKVKAHPVKIVDTRKTTPGLRLLEKYAVRMGGGFNHRLGLYDAILIKDNHVSVAGGITVALKNTRTKYPDEKIEVEVRNLEQVKQALDFGADIIMLDNFALSEIKKAVEMVNRQVVLEASGGIILENVEEIAATGVDLISIGALTHSAPAVDISLEVEAPTGTTRRSSPT